MSEYNGKDLRECEVCGITTEYVDDCCVDCVDKFSSELLERIEEISDNTMLSEYYQMVGMNKLIESHVVYAHSGAGKYIPVGGNSPGTICYCDDCEDGIQNLQERYGLDRSEVEEDPFDLEDEQ